MKKIPIILLATLFSCSLPKYTIKQLTVTHIQVGDSTTEVYASKGYMVWLGKFTNLPDSVRIGTILNVLPSNIDSCECIFKRIK